MDPRFVTKKIHAVLDYPVAFGLITFPFLLGLGELHPFAFLLSLYAGIAALILTVFTDHHLGVFRILPFWLHLTADALVGITFITLTIILGFAGLDAAYYYANGLAVLTVVGLHRPEKVAFARAA